MVTKLEIQSNSKVSSKKMTVTYMKLTFGYRFVFNSERSLKALTRLVCEQQSLKLPQPFIEDPRLATCREGEDSEGDEKDDADEDGSYWSDDLDHLEQIVAALQEDLVCRFIYCVHELDGMDWMFDIGIDLGSPDFPAGARHIHRSAQRDFRPCVDYLAAAAALNIAPNQISFWGNCVNSRNEKGEFEPQVFGIPNDCRFCS